MASRTPGVTRIEYRERFTLDRLRSTGSPDRVFCRANDLLYFEEQSRVNLDIQGLEVGFDLFTRRHPNQSGRDVWVLQAEPKSHNGWIEPAALADANYICRSLSYVDGRRMPIRDSRSG